MTHISDSYRELNAELHDRRPDYGAGGHRYSDMAIGMLVQSESKTFLDIGCGKDTLRKAMRQELLKLGMLDRFALHVYDPALLEHSAEPLPADVVFATDVAEHIEPEHVEDWLRFFASKTKKLWFMTVATRPAVKVLADGRNAHLSIHPWLWWAEKIDAIMPINTINVLGPMEVHFYGAKQNGNGLARDH
jgi:hypothetical protein